MHIILEYLALRGGISVYDGMKKGKQGKELVEHATEHAVNNAVGETITNVIQAFWLTLVILVAGPLVIAAPIPGIAVLNVAVAHHNIALIVLGILLIPLGFWLWLKFMFAAKRWMKRKKSWQFSEELDAERIAWSEQYGLPQETEQPEQVPNLAIPRQIEK